MTKSALIVGTGPGLGASLARTFSEAGYQVAVASRSAEKIQTLCDEHDVKHIACDVSDLSSIEAMYAEMDATLGAPEVVVFNASARTRGPVAELDLESVRSTLEVNALGALAVAQGAAQRMLKAGHGTMLFTGASAGVKGYAQSAPFAMGKFAMRGMCQSLSRELAPKNIHVAYVVIDGLIYNEARGNTYADREVTLNPDEIAHSYLALAQQHNSAWTYEIELRPFVETF